jgi:hypothetical protein
MNEQYLSGSLDIAKVEKSYIYDEVSQRRIPLSAIMVDQNFNEQRKYPRFKPDSKIFILHSSLGEVSDISVNGLSYTYYHLPTPPSKPLPKVGTIFGARMHFLRGVPFTVVGDTVIQESYSCFPALKQCRIHFSRLTGKQLQDLEQFILIHAIVPKPDIVE